MKAKVHERDGRREQIQTAICVAASIVRYKL